MANPLKGEVAVVIGGHTYTLAFPINTLIAMEEELDAELTTLGRELQGGRLSISKVRELFRFALLARHPEYAGVEMSVAAGELIGELGFVIATQKVTEAFLGAFATAEEVAELGDGGPRKPAPRSKAAAGTGRRPTAPGES